MSHWASTPSLVNRILVNIRSHPLTQDKTKSVHSTRVTLALSQFYQSWALLEFCKWQWLCKHIRKTHIHLILGYTSLFSLVATTIFISIYLYLVCYLWYVIYAESIVIRMNCTLAITIIYRSIPKSLKNFFWDAILNSMLPLLAINYASVVNNIFPACNFNLKINNAIIGRKYISNVCFCLDHPHNLSNDIH